MHSIFFDSNFVMNFKHYILRLNQIFKDFANKNEHHYTTLNILERSYEIIVIALKIGLLLFITTFMQKKSRKRSLIRDKKGCSINLLLGLLIKTLQSLAELKALHVRGLLPKIYRRRQERSSSACFAST